MKLRTAAGATARWTHRNAIDLSLVGGYAAIAVGCGWIFRPAGLIVGGVLSSVTALAVGRAEEPSASQRRRNPEGDE